MKIRGIIGLSMVASVTMCSVAQAGPCSKDIDAMQARVDAKLESIAARGRFAPESAAAGMSVQPTPHSIAVAEEKLGEINQHMVRNIRRAMTRARAADARGNTRRCEKELSRVQRALGPL